MTTWMTQNCYHFVIKISRFSPLGHETVKPWMKGIHRKGLKMSFTPVQRKQIDLTFKGQCVSCLKEFNNLWNAEGFALTDESSSDGFCHSCWNY